MRTLLFDHLTNHFAKVSQSLSVNPLATCQFEEPGQLVYDEAIKSKWIGTDR
jgi:hypothetical protein